MCSQARPSDPRREGDRHKGGTGVGEIRNPDERRPLEEEFLSFSRTQSAE